MMKNCTISINASQAGGYADNSWIAVAVSVRDYNRRDISYGSGVFLAGKFSLSTTSVQVSFPSEFICIIFIIIDILLNRL
jgi:hypothetical protein